MATKAQLTETADTAIQEQLDERVAEVAAAVTCKPDENPAYREAMIAAGGGK